MRQLNKKSLISIIESLFYKLLRLPRLDFAGRGPRMGCFLDGPWLCTNSFSLRVLKGPRGNACACMFRIFCICFVFEGKLSGRAYIPNVGMSHAANKFRRCKSVQF